MNKIIFSLFCVVGVFAQQQDIRKGGLSSSDITNIINGSVAGTTGTIAMFTATNVVGSSPVTVQGVTNITTPNLIISTNVTVGGPVLLNPGDAVTTFSTGTRKVAQGVGGLWAINSNTIIPTGVRNGPAYGYEADVNNNDADVAITSNPADQIGGIFAISGGTFKPLFGFRTTSSSAGARWQYAALLQNWSANGLKITQDAGVIGAPILLVPGADDYNPSIQGLNAAGSTTAWQINNNGGATFSAPVGIGVTPISSFHVQVGDVIPAAGANPMNSGVVVAVNNSSVALNLGTRTTGHNYSWINSAFANSSGTASDLALQSQGGNVGIGTNAPNSKLDLNGEMNISGESAPSVSATNAGKIYFDTTTKKLMASESGAAYVNVIGAGTITGSGTANTLPKFTGASAIGNSKVTDDGTTVTVTASDNVLVSGGTVTLQNTNTSAGALIIKSETGTDNAVQNESYSPTVSAGFVGKRARGTIASPTAAQSGDLITKLGARPFGATAFASGDRARVGLYDKENATDSAMGTYATVETTPTGSTTIAERVRVNDTDSVFATTLALGATTATPDVYLVRDGAANTLGLRNGVNAQTLWVYGTYTDASNYERMILAADASNGYVGTYKAGNGTARNLALVTGSSIRWFLGATTGTMTPQVDATYSVGDPTHRIKQYFGGGSTETTSNPIMTWEQTWNTAGTTYTGLKLNVTATAAAAASLLLDLQVGGSSAASVRKDGLFSGLAFTTYSSGAYFINGNAALNVYTVAFGASLFSFPSGYNLAFSSTTSGEGTKDANFSRITAGEIGFGTGAQGSTAGTVNTTSLKLQGKVTVGNGVTTAGNGVPFVYGANRATGQTAGNTNVVSYTNGAADGSFEVSANVLVTTSSAEAFTVAVLYTDEGNTARVQTLPFISLAGSVLTQIAFANGAVPYEGCVIHLRVKASTTIYISVPTSGTFTGCTYNVGGIIKQTQ